MRSREPDESVFSTQPQELPGTDRLALTEEELQPVICAMQRVVQEQGGGAGRAHTLLARLATVGWDTRPLALWCWRLLPLQLPMP